MCWPSSTHSTFLSCSLSGTSGVAGSASPSPSSAPHRFSSFLAVNAPHPWLPHRKLLPQVWRFWYTALLEYPVLGAWVIRTRPGVLRWLLRRGRPGLPDAEVEIFAAVAREPARARAGQQLHWQVVVRDIPRRAER